MTENVIKIGAIATLIGPFATMGEDAMRGVDLALAEFSAGIGGKSIELLIESSNAIPESASDAAAFLIDRKGVDLVIGPLSGNEGLAVRDYAKTRLDKTFINGVSASQDMTLRDSAPNFFSFSMNGVQWMTGLGSYAHHTLGYRRVVTLAQDYSYPHSQVGGFVIEFCRAGGHVVDKFWMALGTNDSSSIIRAMPTDIDAIFVALSGEDAIVFLEHYAENKGTLPLIGGSSTVDQTILSTKGMLYDRAVGMIASGPIADENPDPAWQNYVKTYRDRFPDGLSSPSLFCYGYYLNTKAGLLALTEIDGDLSNGQVRFQEILSHLEFDTPTGPVKLDHNRNAIGTVYITIVDRNADGRLSNRLIKTIPNATQTLGLPEDEYLQIGPFNHDNPPCL